MVPPSSSLSGLTSNFEGLDVAIVLLFLYSQHRFEGGTRGLFHLRKRVLHGRRSSLSDFPFLANDTVIFDEWLSSPLGFSSSRTQYSSRSRDCDVAFHKICPPQDLFLYIISSMVFLSEVALADLPSSSPRPHPRDEGARVLSTYDTPFHSLSPTPCALTLKNKDKTTVCVCVSFRLPFALLFLDKKKNAFS